VKTLAQLALLQEGRNAFGPAMRAVVMTATSVIWHCAKRVFAVSRVIRSNGKRSNSIRGADPLVATG